MHSVGIIQTASEWLFHWKSGENTTCFEKQQRKQSQKKQMLQKGEEKKNEMSLPISQTNL